MTNEVIPRVSRVSTDMVHSEDELRHALAHLLQKDCGGDSEYLHGHECLTLYRNVRQKYVDYPIKTGPRKVCSFRSVDEGVLASYQAGVCFEIERPASTIYVNINPRHVPNALKETHTRYYQWLEYKAGASKQQVRKGSQDDFAGNLNLAFEMQLSRCQSRERFAMVDVDDDDPTTWLASIRNAIGEDAIEMIVETKNGFHVVYQKRKLTRESHMALADVLQSDEGSGKDAKVTSMNGSAIACALPGVYQADHRTRILACSCKDE